jgi:hypothetical protein
MALDDDAESEIIKFQRLRLSLKFLINLVGTGQFLKPEAAIPPPAEKVCPSYLPNKPLIKIIIIMVNIN